MTELAEDGAEEIVVIVILCVSGVSGDDEEDTCLMGVLYIVAGESDGESWRRRPLISFGSLRDLADARLSISIGSGDSSLVLLSLFSCCCDDVGDGAGTSCGCSASLCFELELAAAATDDDSFRFMMSSLGGFLGNATTTHSHAFRSLLFFHPTDRPFLIFILNAFK